VTHKTIVKSTNHLTTAPAKADDPGEPEFLDAEGVQARFGIKRTLLFRLLAAGKIRGVCLREPGRVRGKRLFICEDLRAFLLSNVGLSGWNPRAIANARRKEANANGAATT
jgi:hypothetical protein